MAVKAQGVARLHGPADQVGLAPLLFPVRHDLQTLVAELVILLVLEEALGLVDLAPAMAAAHELDRAVARHGVQRHPDRAHLIALDRPVGHVLVPGGARTGLGAAHEDAVEIDVDARRPGHARGQFGGRRMEQEIAVFRIVLPDPGIAEEEALFLAPVLGVVAGLPARIVQIALDALGQNLLPVCVEDTRDHDRPVLAIGADIGLGDAIGDGRCHAVAPSLRHSTGKSGPPNRSPMARPQSGKVG
jgi:hypothetical protein